tara:strand:- start:54 stop:491 length:438 start_codon:yes stop_codon:yes gene_type:complete
MKNFMIKTLCLTFIFIFIASCTFTRLEKGLDSLLGKSMNHAINLLGMPNAERTIRGQKIYAWGHSFTYSKPSTSNSTSSGTIDGEWVSINTSTTSYTPTNLSCSIELYVNSKDIVTNYMYDGNAGACENYAQWLGQGWLDGLKGK